MAIPWGPILSGGASVVSSLLSRDSGSGSGADQTNAFNAQQAQINRDWQEKFYKSRHQWEVEDLIKAGLNPVLSAKFGGGGVPTGAQASAHSNPATEKLASQSLMLESAKTVKELALMQAQKSNIDADTAGKLGTFGFMGSKVPISEIKKLVKEFSDGQTNAKDGSGFWSDMDKFGNSKWNPLNRSIAVKFAKDRKWL